MSTRHTAPNAPAGSIGAIGDGAKSRVPAPTAPQHYVCGADGARIDPGTAQRPEMTRGRADGAPEADNTNAARRAHPQVRPVPATARGCRLGQFHAQAVMSDQVVERVRSMRAAGYRLDALAAAIGTSRHTVQSWTLNRRRCTPAARHIVTTIHRAADMESVANQALERLAALVRKSARDSNPEEPLA